MLLLSALLLAGCTAEAPEPTFFFESDTYSLVQEEEHHQVFEAETSDNRIIIQPGSEDEWEYSVLFETRTGTEEYLVSGTSRNFSVRFPDGRTLRRSHRNGSSTGSAEPGTPTDFDDWDRVDGLGIIVFGVPESIADEGSNRNVFIGLLCVVAGLLSTANPRLAFVLDLGWRLRDGEPSEAYLVITRIAGIAIMLVGVFLIMG